MRSKVNRALFLLLGAGSLVAPAVAQKSALKKALPAKTIFYVSAPDLDRSIEEMMVMPLARMWREEEVQDFFGDLLKLADKKIEEGLEQGRQAHASGQFPFDPDQLMKLRVHGFTLALTELDLRKTEQGIRPRIGITLHLNFGDSAGKWREIIDYGIAALEQQAQDQVQRKEAAVGDFKMVSLTPTQGDLGDLGLHWAWMGDSLALSTLSDDLRGSITAIATDQAVLTDSKNYKESFRMLDNQGAELEVFVQPGALVEFGLKALAMAKEEEPDFPPMINIEGIARAVDALGLNSVLAAAETMSYVDGRSVSKGYTYSPEPIRKGLFAGGNKQLSLDFLRWVPKDVASFEAFTFDLAAIYDAIEAGLKAYDEEFAAHVLGQLAHYEEQIGVNLKEDLVGAVGNEFMMWSMPSAGLMSTPELSVLIKIKDEQRLLKALQTIAKLTNNLVEIEAAERRGITVHRVHVNYDPSGNIGMNPFDMFSPNFAFKDGYLVGGFSTSDIKRTFARMDRQDDDPKDDVRGNVEFAPYLSQLPDGGLTSLSFTDWKANFESLYQMLTSAAAFVPVGEQIPIDLSLLPDSSTLTKHLFGSLTYKMADGNGFRSVTHSPWGAETYMGLGLLGGAAGVGVAWTNVKRW